MTARIELPDKFAGRKGVRVRQSTGITASSSRDGFICANDSPLTHAEMDENFNSTWPIGSIYINVSSSENPKKLIGFGTWESFGRRQIMVGVNNSPAGMDSARNSPAENQSRFERQRTKLGGNPGVHDTMFSKQIQKMAIVRNVAFIKFYTPHKFCVGQKLTLAGIREDLCNSTNISGIGNVNNLHDQNWITKDKFANRASSAPNLNRGDCEIIALGTNFQFGQENNLGVISNLTNNFANNDYCVTILFGFEKNNIRNNPLGIELPGSGGRGVDDLIEYLENQAVEEGSNNLGAINLHDDSTGEVLKQATATLFGTQYGGPYRSQGQPFIDVLNSSPEGFGPEDAQSLGFKTRVNSPGNAIRYQEYLKSWYVDGATTHYGGSPTRFSPSMSYPNFTVGEGGKDSIYLREYQLPRHEHNINWEICKIKKLPTEGIMFPLQAGQDHGDGRRRKSRNGWGYNSGAIVPRPVGISCLRKNAYKLKVGKSTNQQHISAGRTILNGFINNDAVESVNYDTIRKLDRRGNRLVLINTSLNLGPYGANEDQLKYSYLYEGNTFDVSHPIEHEVRSSRRHFDERIETYKNSLGQRVFHDEPGGTQSADGSGDRTFGPTSYPMGLPHSNLMPFITAYFWRRIA